LLGGERAHYELAAGRDIREFIKSYEAFAGVGQMLPEQVWDEPDVPEHGMIFGGSAGSAVPLVWAHAEYLKLLRSALDGKVFDRIDAVYGRYSEPEGRKRVRRGLEIYSRRRPIHTMGAGSTLRVIDGDDFEVVWTCDGWQTQQTTRSRSLGSAGFSADLVPHSDCKVLEWTMHWVLRDAWLGYNVKVSIETV